MLPDRSNQPRTLRAIAGEIKRTWANIHPTAAPYVGAMRSLEKVTDRYGADSGEYIVRYFLSNARSWTGDDARRIKAELKAMVGMK